MPPLTTSLAAPATLSQPSRKGKKAWRKNVDISTITTGLESLREEIRTTGGPIAEKPTNELFIFDNAGSEEIKRTHKLTKLLKVDQILAERSAVPAVDSRKRKSDRALLSDGVYESSAKRRKEGWVAKKDVQRIKSNLNNTSHLDKDKVGDEDAEFDLWAAPAPEPAVPTQKDEYIPKQRAKVAPASIAQAPIAMTASGKSVKAVSNPDAGTSYNPTAVDWAALILREGEKEAAAEQERLAKAQAEAEKQAQVDLIAIAKDDEVYETGNESAWEGFETENDDESLKKKRPQRKTPQQRKKVERRKETERQAKHEAATGRKRKQSLEAVKAMVKANTKNELVEAEEITQTEDTTSEEDPALRRRKMGPIAIPEKHLEVVLAEEMQESLRRLKPEGNLMTDRFRNLLVNGKIEARKRVLQPKKRKVKATEKWSHKDFDLGIEV